MPPRTNAQTLSQAETGFPWEKVRAAQQFLILLKGYWSRFSGRVRIVPMYTPPPPGAAYGSLTATTPDFDVFVDRAFASKEPVEVIAWAIEHEYMHHTSDTWNRLSEQEPHATARYQNIVCDLEINYQLIESYREISMEMIEQLARKSHSFTLSELKKWGIRSAPHPPANVWIGENPELNMPGDRTAEEFFDALYQPAPPSQQPQQSGGGGDKQQEGGDDSQEGTDDASDDTDTDTEKGERGGSGDSDQSDEKAEGGPEDDEQASSADPESTDEDDLSDSDKGGEGEKGGESGGGSPSDDSDSGDPGDDEPSGGQSSEGGGGDPGIDANDPADPDGVEQPESGGGPTTEVDGSGGGSGEGGQSSSDGGAGRDEPTLADKIEAMRAENPELDMWAEDMGKDENGKQADWMPPDYQHKLPTVAERQRIEALGELSDDILDAMANGHRAGGIPGLKAGSSMVKFANAQASSVKAEVSVEAMLHRVLSTTVTGASVKGASDLTYSVRNPNQPMFGPILQGMHSFAPQVYFLMDVSYSMVPFIKRYLGVFQSVSQGVTGTFGASVVWLTVDTQIQQAGEDLALTDEMIGKWGMGMGGTDLGSVMDMLMTEGLTYEGKTWPKADVLFVATDGEFGWPWGDTESVNPFNKDVIVASHNSYSDLARYGMPKWITDRQHYVKLPPRPPTPA